MKKGTRMYVPPKADLIEIRAFNSILNSFSLGSGEGEDWQDGGYLEVEFDDEISNNV